MTDKIESLTEEQVAFLQEQKEKWLKIGLSTELIDYPNAIEFVKGAYEKADLPPPVNFLRFASPLSASAGIAILKEANLSDEQLDEVQDTLERSLPENASFYKMCLDYLQHLFLEDAAQATAYALVERAVYNLWFNAPKSSTSPFVYNFNEESQAILTSAKDAYLEMLQGASTKIFKSGTTKLNRDIYEESRRQINNMAFGCHDAPWFSFYDTFLQFGVKEVEKLVPLIELAKVCGWWSAFEDTAVLQERPKAICFDDADRLHGETGPAIAYRDGFEIYVWHGVRIPGEWIKDKSSLTAAKALKVDNVEQRRCACEIIGWHQILHELNAVTIDADENKFVGNLVEVEIPEIGTERFLHVLCGTGREFALPVPLEMKTAKEAQVWLNWGEDITTAVPKLRT